MSAVLTAEATVAKGVDGPRVERAVREYLLAIGEDPERPGLADTPARVARAAAEMFGGLHQDPLAVLDKTFDLGHGEMVIVKDIPFYSTCEHHLVPFHGVAHVGYAVERHQVMLARGVERDVLDDDHFTVAKVEGLVQHGQWVLVESAIYFGRCPGHAGGGVREPGPVRVLPDGQEVIADGLLHPGPVHTCGGRRSR
jgi:hypothetical protein